MNKQDKLHKNIFWDYKEINTDTDLGMITYLNRVIMFGKFEKEDMENIKKYLDELTITDYWKYYFIVYFKKYSNK